MRQRCDRQKFRFPGARFECQTENLTHALDFARDDDLSWSVDVGDKHWTLFAVDARDELGCLRLVQADDRRESVSSRTQLFHLLGASTDQPYAGPKGTGTS